MIDVHYRCEQLREQARASIEKGAVTPTYQAMSLNIEILRVYSRQRLSVCCDTR